MMMRIGFAIVMAGLILSGPTAQAQTAQAFVFGSPDTISDVREQCREEVAAQGLRRRERSAAVEACLERRRPEAARQRALARETRAACQDEMRQKKLSGTAWRNAYAACYRQRAPDLARLADCRQDGIEKGLKPRSFALHTHILACQAR